MERLPVVGVVGSGASLEGGATAAAWVDRATQLGRWLAGRGVHLLTGGGAGVMAAVAQAFVETPGRRGLSLGVVPGDVTWGVYRPVPGYPNDWVELVLRTHLPQRGDRGLDPASRNHLVVLSSDVLVALPGGAGTRTECVLSQRYGVPLIAWVESDDELPGLPAELPRAHGLASVEVFVATRLPR